jgi:hypothetical protein
MPATFSPEAQIDIALRDLDCSGRSFVDIARAAGVQIAHGPFSEALNGKKAFERNVADRLTRLVVEMKQLQRDVPEVPIAWTNHVRIANALTVRRLQRAAVELDDHRFDGLAEEATKSL